VKLTHQRLEICREVAESGDHPDAETVYTGVKERVPTVSLDTVYRTLHLLLDLGLIEMVGASRESMRFDGNTAPHHHFTCAKCGLVHDFVSDEFDRLIVPADVKALGAVRKIQVDVRGICRTCSETEDG
jgi:Fur family peroxide stress response transcriptional regulator